MKRILLLLSIIFISSQANAQLYVSTGAKVGELTGVQLQLYTGYVCGGHQDVLNKFSYYTLTAGYSRLIGKTRSLDHDGKTYVLNKPDFRMQLDAGFNIVHAFDTDISVMMGLSGGQRSYEVEQNNEKAFTMGLLPGLSLEHTLWHSRSRNAPVYLTLFGEGTVYKELGEVSFWDVYVSGGLRFNFYN